MRGFCAVCQRNFTEEPIIGDGAFLAGPIIFSSRCVKREGWAPRVPRLRQSSAPIFALDGKGLQITVQGILNPETADTGLPVTDAEFARSGDPWIVMTDEEVVLTRYDIGEPPLLIHTQPGEGGRRYGVCTLLIPALGARLTVTECSAYPAHPGSCAIAPGPHAAELAGRITGGERCRARIPCTCGR
jgi:hypothetical protein